MLLDAECLIVKVLLTLDRQLLEALLEDSYKDTRVKNKREKDVRAVDTIKTYFSLNFNKPFPQRTKYVDPCMHVTASVV
jgi:hypothetical protein